MAEQSVSKQELKKQAMLNGPVPQTIMKMAVPTIVSFLISSIYSLADTYFVSGIGTNATAAVSVNASLDQIIFMMGSMLAVGGNSYIARLLGARDDKKANQVLSTSFFTAIFLGTVMLVIGTVFMKPMVRMLGATPTCEQYSIEYATYVLLVAPIMASSFVLNQCLRAEGSAIFSMFGMSFGGILNCILDPIFINGMGLGVAGASMATAISKLVSWCILLYPYLRKRTILHISFRSIKYSRDIVGEVVSVGSSSLLRSGLAVVSAIILNNLAGNYSDALLAGIGVTNKIMMFPFSIILGFGSGFQPVTGYNWGAKQYDRVHQTLSFSSKVAILGSIVMGAFCAIFANTIISWFTEADAEMMWMGALCIRLQSFVLPVHAWVAVVNMFCAGIGFASGAVILATARQGTCFIPFVFLLNALFHEYGILSIQAVADLLSIILAVVVLRKAMKKVRAAEQAVAVVRDI
ncbi:MAG: MATE family efflux transporter [Lachnospiraceae bacterium]|nr:MATE family efflux transporter [Lachnospiraceae bacterium]